MSELQTITLDGVKYAREDSINTLPQPDGDYVIVRCRNAGVHAGYIELRNANILRLTNSRRLWRWWSKFTLSGLATCGVLKGKECDVRFACVLPKLDLTNSDICEVIYCTKEARESIQSIREYNENE